LETSKIRSGQTEVQGMRGGTVRGGGQRIGGYRQIDSRISMLRRVRKRQVKKGENSSKSAFAGWWGLGTRLTSERKHSDPS